MARTVTASAMITRARELADMVTSSPTTAFVTDVEALAQLNLLIGPWHSMLLQAAPERFEADQTIVANGAASYALPWDHYKTLAVDYQVASNSWWPLDRVMLQERTDFESSGSSASGYRIKGATLVLIPAPASGTYRHTYVTAAPTLLAETSLDGVNGWEMWLVYSLAVFMVLKEESLEMAAALAAERDKVKAEIEAYAADREAANPMRVVDTRLRRH